MPYEQWPAMLLIVSVLTNFGVEGLKALAAPKVINNKNIVALMISFCLSGLTWAMWYVNTNVVNLTWSNAIDFVFFLYVTFITTTVGYDKVLKTFKELKTGGFNNE